MKEIPISENDFSEKYEAVMKKEEETAKMLEAENTAFEEEE